MCGQAGFFDVDERLKQLSAKGDSLERLNTVVDFELFRADLERAVPRSDRAKGGRPPFDHVLMFKTLVLQTSHNLSDERTEYLIRDRLSFMRFLGLGLADTVPDANTIWTFREGLTRARIAGKPAIEVLFERFDTALSTAGFLAMSGQIIDASIVAAPKQRNTDGEKRDIKEGRIPPQWAATPAKLRQKDRDARWTVKYTKAKPSAEGMPRVDLAVPAFGYKNHIGIDRRHRLIHQADQFQVVVAGRGMLGEDEFSDGVVHYTDAYSAYGPIVAGKSGIWWFTLRNRWDPGARYMPAEREVLSAARDRHQHWELTTDPMPSALLSELCELTIISCRPVLEAEDGLAGWRYRIPPCSTIAGRAPSAG